MFVIGDLHGRIDLLDRVLEKADGAEQIICVGDYVDRGERSADVLARLQARDDIVCLKGNHEDMMMSFIEDPQNAGPRWLRYGGLQTLASYGVSGVSDTSRGAELETARDQMTAKMGTALIDWLHARPLRYQSGNVAVVHAGADPACPVDQQSNSVLLWGHPDFLKKQRQDGTWVVHGHTIVDDPSAQNGRVSVDTGAYATGRLTAARISGDGVTFVSA